MQTSCCFVISTYKQELIRNGSGGKQYVLRLSNILQNQALTPPKILYIYIIFYVTVKAAILTQVVILLLTLFYSLQRTNSLKGTSSSKDFWSFTDGAAEVEGICVKVESSSIAGTVSTN